MHNDLSLKSHPFKHFLDAMPGRPDEFSAAIAKFADDPSAFPQLATLPDPFIPVDEHTLIQLMAKRVLLNSPDILPALTVLARMGVDLNQHGPRSPIRIALETGASRLHFARALLQAGASPEGDPREHYSPLHNCAGQNLADGISLLLEFGADPDRLCASRTALHEAVRHGHVEACKTLLDKGASVYILDDSGLSALEAALALPSDHQDCAQLFREEMARREAQIIAESALASGIDLAPTRLRI